MVYFMAFQFRQHKILTAISAVFALLFLGVVILVLFSEPLIRSFTNHRAGGKIGREFAIDGALDINWDWNKTRVHAEKIRLANAEGYAEPEMVTIESVDFDFKPAKLLLGRLEFGEIEINKPNIVLEKKAPGETNWEFPALSNANLASEAAIPDSRKNFPIIGNIMINNGRLIYRDGVKNLNLDLELETVSGSGGNKKKDGAGFKISGDGLLQKQKFVLDASGGSLEALRDSSQDFPLNLKLVMGPTEIVVNGAFKDPVKMTGVDASLEIKGHNLADIFYLTAIPLPPTPPYLLKGQLTKEGEVWGYKDFTGKVGGSDLSGNLSYDTSGERGFLKAELVSNLLDSRDLGGFIGLSPDGKNAAPEQKAEAAKEKADSKLIPDVPLEVKRLRAADLDVTLKAKKIEAPGLPFKGLDVRFDLQNGILKLDPLNIVLADGTVDGSVEINGQHDIPPMKMDLNLRKLSLKQFFGNTRFEDTTQGYFGGKVNLAGTGASLADVLATSNGNLSIIMSGGTISLLLVEASDLDIGQALPLFMGKDKATPIRCGVMDFDVKNGILKSKIFVLDTADSLLLGNVGIDMKRELISAKLDSKPKDNSLLSAQTPIIVSGELKKPSIGIDPARAGARGAAAAILGTLLTPFAAIIPFIEAGDVQNANCRALINEAKK